MAHAQGVQGSIGRRVVLPICSLSTDPLPVRSGRGEQASYQPDHSKRAFFPSRVAIPMRIWGALFGRFSSLHILLSRAPNRNSRSQPSYFLPMLPFFLPFRRKREKVFSVVEARGYVGNPQGCPSGCRVTAKQLSTGAAYPQPYLKEDL